MADNAESVQNFFLNQMKEVGLYCSASLSDNDISADVLDVVSMDLAMQYHILPLRYEGEYLVVVTDTVQTFKQRISLEGLLHRKIRLLLAAEDNIRLALLKFYGIRSYRQQQNFQERYATTDNTPLQGMINNMLQAAARAHASDIHLLPKSTELNVCFRINGHMYDVSADYPFPVDKSPNVISLIKQMDISGNADFMQTNMPNEGSFFITHGNEDIFVRLETLPIGNTDSLEKVNLRLLPQAATGNSRKKLEDIGYTKEDLTAIKMILYKNATGLFINSGPTGAGKTTSLYAQIHYVVDTIGEPLNVITIDDPIEIRDEDFTQVQVRKASNEALNLTDMKILIASLRSDPDIILDNEIRDAIAATVAMQASNTGHRVFSTVHAADCIRTIARLLDFDISKTTLLSELKMIISQRLVAKLCPHCSHEHELTELERSVLNKEELALIQNQGNLREPGTIEEISACGKCNYGFIGRTAVAEYVDFNMDIRDALLDQHSFRQVKDILKKYGFQSMWEKGFEMVLRGEIELNELIRVVGKEE